MKKTIIFIAATLLSNAAVAQTICDLGLGDCLLKQAIGPQGPVGPVGPAGESIQGPAGPQGAPGPQGIPGAGGGSMIPGGRLTLIPGKPVMDVDATSATVWYAPYGGGNTFPVLDATLTWTMVRYASSPTDRIGAALTLGSKLVANTNRDSFGTISGAICAGPAWPASDEASRHLALYDGKHVNDAAIVCDTSASTSITCPQYQCTYLGSIRASIAGQLTATLGYGTDRRREVWTAYAQNQIDVAMRVGVPAGLNGYMPTNQYPYNGVGSMAYFGNPPSALNRAVAFTGLPTNVDVEYNQSMFINSTSGASGLMAAVCRDGLNYVGYFVKFSSDNTSTINGTSGTARYNEPAMLGNHDFAMCVAKGNTATSTVWGASPSPNYNEPEINHMMLVRYRG